MGSKVNNTQYQQKFRKEWLEDPLLKTWLVPVEGQSTKARCKVCKVNLTARLKDLKDHSKTDKHRKAAEPFSPESRQKPLSFVAEKIPPKSVQTLVITAALTLFVVCHAAVRAIDHLTDLTKRVCTGFLPTVDLQLHRTKCSQVIKEVFAPFFRRDLREDIGDSYFSLLLDESTDIGVNKQLGICIRYFSTTQRRIVDTFLCLIRLDDGTAKSIVAGVKKSLQTFGLQLQKLLAIGTDNASVMTGVNAGVYALLKQEVPSLMLIRCLCHSCQLAVSEAVKECLPRSLEFLLSATYNWFAKSSNRQVQYAALYKAINDGADPLKIVQAASTRWLSIEVAVVRILNQWLELETHFSIMKDTEKCFTAQLLHSMYTDVTNQLYLLFLKPVLASVQKVNKAFQANNADPFQLLQDLTLLINSLAKMVVVTGCRENLLKVNVRNHLHPRPYLGVEVEMKITEYRQMKKLSQECEINLRQRCIDFLIRLVSELQNRLPDSVERLSRISELSPKNALRAVNASIVPLAEAMNKSPATIALIDSQWKMLNCVQWDCKTDTLGFWREVSMYRNAIGTNSFQELVDLAIECLTLPWSNAEIERLFSQMNILKSPHRNRLSDEMLNSLLSIRTGVRRHGKCCDTFEFPRSLLEKISSSTKYPPKKTKPADQQQQRAEAESVSEESAVAAEDPDEPDDEDFDGLVGLLDGIM